MNRKKLLDFFTNPANKQRVVIWARNCGKTQLKIDLLNHMNTKTYDLSYDYCPIATVQITDSEKTREVIKEMVEFWGNWEDRLRDNGGDYTKTWLKQLVIEILCSGHPPDKN